MTNVMNNERCVALQHNDTRFYNTPTVITLLWYEEPITTLFDDFIIEKNTHDHRHLLNKGIEFK